MTDDSRDMDIEDASLFRHNAHWERHKYLLSKGWTIEHGSYSQGKVLLKVSPERKLQFISTGAAEEFEKIRQECRGDEYEASPIFESRMIQQGHKLSKLLVNGRSALSCNNSRQKPVFGHCKKKMATRSKRDGCCESLMLKTQLSPRQRKALNLIPVQQRSRAIKCLAKLSPGWMPVNYQCSTKQELHFETPQKHIKFKSFTGALSFDSLLKQSSNESIAFDAFVEKEGRKKVRSLVYSFGSHCIGKAKSSN